MAPAGAHADPRRVDGNGPKQSLDFAGSAVSQASELRAVPADASAGGEFLHLGLQDQARELGQQTFAFRQSQADLLCCEPDHPSLNPADLNGFHLTPTCFSLKLRHPFHVRPPIIPEGTIFLSQCHSDQGSSTLKTRRCPVGRMGTEVILFSDAGAAAVRSL
jgi:hypothetical protein